MTFLLGSCLTAAALVGNAEIVRGTGAGRHIVIVVGTRGSFCTGTALGRDLVLTAGHCVAPAASYRVVLPGMKPPGLMTSSIAIHPLYNRKDYVAGRVTADVALLKLEQPLPAEIVPATLAPVTSVEAGDRLVIAGYGTTAAGSEIGIAAPRAATLVATGKPGTLQIRLFDPATRDTRPGLGACTGDSGGPLFVKIGDKLSIIGVVSWATGAAATAGCGGLTGVTPLQLYRGWLVEQAKKMGVNLHSR
jgi:secreted trypsin-like serine protease